MQVGTAIVENALRNANLSQGDIDEVVLVGGSTRIPSLFLGGLGGSLGALQLFRDAYTSKGNKLT